MSIISNRPTISIIGQATDAANAVAVVIDNENTISTAGAKLLSIRNNGVETFFVAADGSISTPGSTFTGSLISSVANGVDAIRFQNNGARLHLGAGVSDYLYSDGTAIHSATYFEVAAGANINVDTIYAHAATTLSLLGSPTDGATAVGTKINTINALVAAGAKILSVQNNGVEKASIDKDGVLTLSGALSTSAVTINAGAGTLNASTFDSLVSGDFIFKGEHINAANLDVFRIGNAFTQLTNSSSNMLSVYNDNFTTKVATISTAGMFNQSGTDSTGTPGSATINKPSGISSIASGQTTCVITNSLATTTSWISITWLGDLGVQTHIPWVTRAAGSFTVNVSAAPASNVAFSWEVSGTL